MAERKEKERMGTLFCSFCGKSQAEVKKLIAGPAVYICDECVALCNDIIAEEVEKEEAALRKLAVPKPAEIKGILDQYVIGQERAKKNPGRGRPQPLQANRLPHGNGRARAAKIQHPSHRAHRLRARPSWPRPWPAS